MATRGRRRPRFEPSMATRGRRPPQHANYVRTTRTVRRPSSNYNTSGHTTGLAHQSRELARHFGKSPRNLMPGSETVAGRPRITTRGGCRPQPESNQRLKTGSQAVFRTDGYLTPGWIQPPDKPVSGFDSIGPGYPPPYINRLPFILLTTTSRPFRGENQ